MSSVFNFFADEVAYREQTGRQAKMPGVTGPSFRCGDCGRTLLIKGRKKTAAGWRCAGCHQAREARKTLKVAA